MIRLGREMASRSESCPPQKPAKERVAAAAKIKNLTLSLYLFDLSLSYSFSFLIVPRL